MSVTVTDLARYKKLPVDFLLHTVGLESVNGGVTIPYYGMEGELIAKKMRSSTSAKNGSRWPKETPLHPYGLWKLEEAAKSGFLIVCEGESNCWTLWFHGLPALGLPGAGTVRCLQREHVESVNVIYALQDPDSGGDHFIKALGARLNGLGLKVNKNESTSPQQRWPGTLYAVRLAVKDASELHLKGPESFLVNLKSDLLRSRPVRPTLCCPMCQYSGDEVQFQPGSNQHRRTATTWERLYTAKEKPCTFGSTTKTT